MRLIQPLNLRSIVMQVLHVLLDYSRRGLAVRIEIVRPFRADLERHPVAIVYFFARSDQNDVISDL